MYVLYVKSPSAKQQWMDAFTKERQIIVEDNEKGACSLCVSIIIIITIAFLYYCNYLCIINITIIFDRFCINSKNEEVSYCYWYSCS